MAREERVWRDRDSSNDARSSEDEGDGREDVLPVKKKGKSEKRKKESPGDAEAEREEALPTGKKAKSRKRKSEGSGDDDLGGDEVLPVKKKVKNGRRKSDGPGEVKSEGEKALPAKKKVKGQKRKSINGGKIGKAEIPSSTADTSQDKSQDLGPDYDAPPSSQPRPLSEDEEEEDNGINQMKVEIADSISTHDEEEDVKQVPNGTAPSKSNGTGPHVGTDLLAKKLAGEITEEEYKKRRRDAKKAKKIAAKKLQRQLELAGELPINERRQVSKPKPKKIVVKTIVVKTPKKVRVPKPPRKEPSGIPRIALIGNPKVVLRSGKEIEHDTTIGPLAPVEFVTTPGSKKDKAKKAKMNGSVSNHFKAVYSGSHRIPEAVRKTMEEAQKAVKEAGPIVEKTVEENASAKSKSKKRKREKNQNRLSKSSNPEEIEEPEMEDIQEASKPKQAKSSNPKDVEVSQKEETREAAKESPSKSNNPTSIDDEDAEPPAKKKKHRKRSPVLDDVPSSDVHYDHVEDSKAKKPQLRDAHGRFLKRSVDISSQQLEEKEEQPVKLSSSQQHEKEKKRPAKTSSPEKKKRQPVKSPFFPETIEKSSPSKKNVSCIPFSPLSAPHFGLIQEKLAHDPFRLLIAVTFLIRTHGKHAIPVFFELMEQYPTPEALANAKKDDIVPIIRHLGLQNQRAETYKMYAQIWLDNPPTKGRRYPVRGYPDPESARDVKKDEIIDDDDERHAWEIGHMTSGPYALDSWRIFCRDNLRGVADSWNGEGTEDGFQPEWMRVVPEDKELRAYLRWMWLKEGFEWDPFTGEKEVASPTLMRAAMDGRIAWDDEGGMRIIDGEGM
ncbi:uncharacterized protein LY89DRAFT_728786 [Mollisia scopiformis]|uniref:HhH-GPD domain-containing protein n=1 Tax=Mollisia scopiformis TaxID=149040 RepID=A0A194XSG0_MOLSC|nr:uncharacterized protein LY89DRAFT_728786 [Mollisia scopiformis]KUJ22667.1 hypothetical protein LY89DRAFT_728786 [Mollisia scopiformis]